MKRQAKVLPDCLTCGVCCVSLRETHVWAEVEPEDYERLGQEWCKRNVIGYSVFDMCLRMLDRAGMMFGGIKTRWRTMRSGPFRKLDVCVCTALRGDIMHKTWCSVYENRPKVCREIVQPGQSSCLDARREFLRMVREIREEKE